MLDLHCHLLPAIDDGATDVPMALEMARQAWDDGIRTVACTPHIYPGMYDNNRAGIQAAIDAFVPRLRDAGIELELVIGADVHLDRSLVEGIQTGRIPTLANSRYLLLEPPHHVAPPRFEETVFELMVAGIVPVITHPERLRWIDDHYDVFKRLVGQGAWMQITAGALTGRFGKRPKYWGERMLDEGLVHVLATDAHHPVRRPPRLAEGRDAAARRIGDAHAIHLVHTRPQGIIDNVEPDAMPPLPSGAAPQDARPFWRRLLGAA